MLEVAAHIGVGILLNQKGGRGVTQEESAQGDIGGHKARNHIRYGCGNLYEARAVGLDREGCLCRQRLLATGGVAKRLGRSDRARRPGDTRAEQNIAEQAPIEAAPLRADGEYDRPAPGDRQAGAERPNDCHAVRRPRVQVAACEVAGRAKVRRWSDAGTGKHLEPICSSRSGKSGTGETARRLYGARCKCKHEGQTDGSNGGHTGPSGLHINIGDGSKARTPLRHL